MHDGYLSSAPQHFFVELFWRRLCAELGSYFPQDSGGDWWRIRS